MEITNILLAEEIKEEKRRFTESEIGEICVLLTDFDDMIQLNAIKKINKLVKNDKYLGKILYSQLTNYIYSLDTETLNIFEGNIDLLLDYALKEDGVDNNVKNFVVKLYDNFHLTLNQIDNTEKIYAKAIASTKDAFADEIKKTEKSYIAILGIFSSVVLAFVGGLTFSTSVLQNMHKVSIYRLLTVIDLIGVVFIDVIFMLFSFISSVKETMKQKKYPIILLIIFNFLALSSLFFVYRHWYVSGCP